MLPGFGKIEMRSGARPENDLVLSFLAVRQAVGILGLSLPIVLLVYAHLFGGGMQPSISEFYYSAMGDVFVGILCAIGVFLIAYKGYRKRPEDPMLGDREASIVAGISVIAVALFPVPAKPEYALCLIDGIVLRCAEVLVDAEIITGFSGHSRWLHFAPAGSFFLSLAWFCFKLFPKGGSHSNRQFMGVLVEHLIYYICGVLILISVAGLVAYELVSPETRDALTAQNYIFWWETLGVYAFSISWLTKGRFLSRPFGLHRRQAQSSLMS